MTEVQDLLWEKWGRFRKRPQKDRAFIMSALVLLPLTMVGLRCFGFRRWKELIEQISLKGRSTNAMPVASKLEMAQRMARAVHSVELHGPATPNCLERSLTLWWLLRRNGLEGELHIGGRKNGPRFEAHAWVELAGVIVNDSPDVHQHYSRFDAPIAAVDGKSSAVEEPIPK